MAVTLQSVVGYKTKPKQDELAVSGKDDILNKKENARDKRKQKMLEMLNKIKPDPETD
jgi:hypothetical protein